MLVNQVKGVAPDRYAILAGLVVFLSKNLKAHDHGIASHPSNNSDDTEEKQSGDHGSSPLRQRGRANKPGEAVPARIRGCAPLLRCAELHGAVCRPSAIQGLL